MRSTIIVETFPSGTQTFICRHIKALRGDVFTINMDARDLEDWSWKPYVKYLRLGQRKGENLPTHVLRRLKEITFGIPAPSWPIGMEKEWDQYVSERRPDVALAEFGPNGICALEACKRHRIPIVVHFHGYDASSLLRFKSYRNRLPDLFERSAAVVVVSKLMLKTLEGLGCPSSKLHLIPCGAPIDEFSISSAVGSQTCHFVAVASFTQQKGPMHTLRAFFLCANRFPDITLTMIGTGKQLPKVQRWVKNNGLSSKVHLLGYQPIKVVCKYMSNSSVFVQHSLTSRKGLVEGWGVSMAEAAASGLPVIATNHGGIPDHVIDGKTGFLVEEADWKAMGEMMARLAQDTELRKKMGTAGRQNIEKVGNLSVQIDKLREVLHKAVLKQS